MKLSVISFTRSGAKLCTRLVSLLSKHYELCQGFVPVKYCELQDEKIHGLNTSVYAWTREQFDSQDGIIFIGATGIAVRAIAPFLQSKTTDPAVVVVDEQGAFSISLLSGHIGGANDLAAEIAEWIGAIPVITTATDRNHLFAVDVFATKNSLKITDLQAAKRISARLLEHKPVGFFCDFPYKGGLPEGLLRNHFCEENIWITYKRKDEQRDTESFLRLIPKCISLGIGCRKNIEESVIEEAICEKLKTENIDINAVKIMASIDLKKEEKGILKFSEVSGIPFQTFSSEELLRCPGEYTESEFVQETTGVGNVCERAAYCAVYEKEKNCRFIFRKTAGDGVTLAAAGLDPEIRMQP